MFVVRKNSRTLNEANEKALTPICSVEVQKIFALLHAQALAAGEAAGGCKIENTAADGNDAKTAVFHSAGEHMIVARPKDETDKDGNPAKISKKEAIKGITEYVKKFCGDDVGNSLKDEDFLALSSDAGSTGSAGSDGGSDKTVDESVPSFNVFLSESNGFRFMVEADNDNDDDDDDDDEGGSDEDFDEMGDEDDSDEASSAEDGDDGDDGDGGDDGDDGDDGDGGSKDKAEDIDEAEGYYVLYGLKIKGLKETTVQDALKQWGSNFLKGFGVTLGSMWGGGGGEAHTIGGLVKGLKGIFGAIDDPDELCSRIQSEMKNKFPKVGDITCEFRDKKTLVRDLDKMTAKAKKVDGWPDGKNKQKINSAQYSMYIHVSKDDIKEPYVNRKGVANIVTMQIKGLFKKFKNMIKANDVIYINGRGLGGNQPSADQTALSKMPSPSEIKKDFYDDKKNFQNKPDLESLNDKFMKANADKNVQKSELAKSLIKIWVKFFKEYGTGKKELADMQEVEDKLLNQYRKIYQDFYKKFAGDDDNDNVSESMFTAYDMLTEMFGNMRGNDCVEGIFEDDTGNDGNKPLDKAEKDKLEGPVKTAIISIANETCQAKKNKVKFTKGMAKFARVDIDLCTEIENSEAAKYNLIGQILEKAKSGDHKFFIMAYFKKPKEIANSEIKNKKKPMNEIEFLDEAGLIDKYIKSNKLSKDDALKDDTIEKIRKTYKKNPPSADAIKTKIQSYFEKHSDGAKPDSSLGFTWKGTPGWEGFTEDNIKKAFENAVDGEIFDFQRYTVEKASPNFTYFGTKIPADVDVFSAFADSLKSRPPEPPIESDLPVYFVVPEDKLDPKPAEYEQVLNGGQSVKKKDITDELLKKLQTEAEKYVGAQVGLNEADEGGGKAEDADDGTNDSADDENEKLVFDSWIPDWGNQTEANGKVDGKPAIIICARFKKDDNGKTPSEPPPKPQPGEDGNESRSSDTGDSLFIIPMPGVTFEKGDDNDMKGAEFDR